MRKLLAICLLVSVSAFAYADQSEVLKVEDAWIPEQPPGARVYGAFMKLHNPGQQRVDLVGASSPDFKYVELHRTVMENGMARMQAQDKMSIEPGSDLILKRGSYHMMLFHPKRALTAGDKVVITLQFGNQQTQDTEVTVRKQSGNGGEGHEHHMHMQ